LESLLLDDVQGKASAGDIAAQLELARQLGRSGDGEKALEWLRRAAATGNREARAALGRRLLTDPPLNPAEGLRLTTEAARDGSGEAAHLLAVLDASGQLGPANWPGALTHLQRSAELGFAVSRAELALLAGDEALSAALAAGETPSAAGTWERLARNVNLPAWMAAPPGRAAHRNPRIAVSEKFASPALCRWLIERGQPHLRRAQTDDPATGRPIYGDGRTNSSAELDLAQTDVVMHLLRHRMSAASGPPPQAMEGVAILHYEPGQQFYRHFDFLDPAAPGYAMQIAQYGQRVLTFLIYLNEGYEGGETEFPAIQWRFKGGLGDALFFWNIDAAGRPDRLTLHAGLAPTSGEKWLLSQWVRGRVT
jgi:hypothetical protein